MRTIYLDHNATTPVDPAVLEAMLPYLREGFGNPSSGHAFGRRAREGVEEARAQVAAAIGATPGEIVFTSGGTEASWLALLGTAEALREGTPGRRLRIASFSLEHPATLDPLERLRRLGDEAILVPPDERGVVRLPELFALWEARMAPSIVSLMHAHNETGVVQPVEIVGRHASQHGTIFHVDAAQTLGKIHVQVGSIGCDLLTIAGHKLYGPKGVGALYVRRGTPLSPPLRGAGQERGLRGGTENVPGIVGLGTACAIARRRVEAGEPAALQRLRERLWEGLRAAVPGIARTADGTATLPNTLHVRFPGASGGAVLAASPEVAASTGSACHAGSDAPPAAIVAMGIPQEQARGSVRLSLGYATDEDAIDSAVACLARGWRAATGGNPDAPAR
ncbi:MAG: cysteine desulfurase [Candidatus Eisenbacteria bacterium]|nr:cysteine desulfurase [Candidatus Eisenbacteria bacterium]